MIKKYLIIFILNILSINAYASNISYMITNDQKTESYIKLVNKKDPVYLKLYCNNIYNNISISLEGLDESSFFNKNYFDSKITFGNNFQKANWKVVYSETGSFYLRYEGEGIQFAQNLFKNGKVLIDMKELGSLKLFDHSSKKLLEKKFLMAFENCSIYF